MHYGYSGGQKKWKGCLFLKMCTSDATCVWSNVRSDLLKNSWGNERHKLTNTEEQNILPGAARIETLRLVVPQALWLPSSLVQMWHVIDSSIHSFSVLVNDRLNKRPKCFHFRSITSLSLSRWRRDPPGFNIPCFYLNHNSREKQLVWQRLMTMADSDTEETGTLSVVFVYIQVCDLKVFVLWKILK